MWHQTSFDMRLKLLLAMRQYLQDNQKETLLGEVSELDETYVPDSYKGRRVPEETDCPTGKHGSAAQKRGISNEQLCMSLDFIPAH